MKKVLVTGARGFIGQPSVLALQKLGFEIYALSTRKINHLDGQITYCQADLHEHDVIKDLIAEIKPSHLLHLAWYVEHGKYWSSPENLKWVNSSINLFEHFINHGGRRIVCAGTCAEYDWHTSVFDQAIIENLSPLKPQTLYGSSKVELLNMLDSLCKQKGISYTWGRIFFPYGPFENPKRLIPSTILSLLQGKTITFHNPHLERDLSFVQDNGEIFAALVDSVINGPINIASGKATKLKQIIDLIAQSLKGENLIEYRTPSLTTNEPQKLYANTERLKNELGLLPHTNLEEGIEKTIRWWKKALPNYLEIKSE